MFYGALKVTIHCWDMFFKEIIKVHDHVPKVLTNTLIWWEYSLSSFVGAKSCYSLECQETRYALVLNLKVLKMYAKFCVSCHVLLRRGYLEGILSLIPGAGSFVHGIFQARILAWVAISPPEDLPDTGIEPTSLASPALAAGFFTTAPSGSPNNYISPN